MHNPEQKKEVIDLLELTTLMHFKYNIPTTQKFSHDIELRKCGPV
jgi:hypothetical protein